MHIKFLCLNIWFGGKLGKPVIDFLKTENADILALQEVRDPKALGLDYPHVHYAPEFLHRMDGEEYVTGNAIFSKYAIVGSDVQFYFEPYGVADESKRETYPFFPRNLQHVVTSVHGTDIDVFNTHGVWGEDGNDTERRLQASDMVIKAIEGKRNVILTGDFNVNEHTQSIDKIGKQLNDIFKNERTTSFNVRRKTSGNYATSVVDFIFISENIKVLSHKSPNIDVSDHLPMIAELEIRRDTIDES